MPSAMWCPRCQGYKHPAEAVCMACAITVRQASRDAARADRRDPARPCPYCGAARGDHSPLEAAHCTRQADASRRAAESTPATLEG